MLTTIALAAALLALPQDLPSAPTETVTLAGRVVDMRGEGVPVAEVWVVDWSEPGKRLAHSVADGEGYFRISRVPKRDSWQIRATTDGRCHGLDFVRSDTDVIVVRVHDAATLHGVLRDLAGKPVAATVVSAESSGRALNLPAITATTDAEGRFELRDVPLGQTQLTAWIPGQGLAELRHRTAGDCEVSLVLSKEATTSFDVTVSGLPDTDRPAVRIHWLPYRGGHHTRLPEPYAAPILEGNSWHAAGVPDWRYLIRLQAVGYSFQPDEIRVNAGEGPHQLQFVATPLRSESLQWNASVTGPDGKPVAGVSLVLRRSNGGARAVAISDAAGKLTFDCPLARGTKVIVYSTHDDWVIHQQKTAGMIGTRDRRFLEDHECVVQPEHELALRVIPATSVTGRVLHADGRPAALVPIQLEESSAGRSPRWMTFAWATTDRDGIYHVRRRHHSPAPVRVLIESRAGTAASDEVSIAEVGTQLQVPPLTLQAPAIVEGVVRDEHDAPVAGIAVWLRDWDMGSNSQRSGSVTEVITDRRGRFRFRGVPLGGAYLQLVLDSLNHKYLRAVEPFEVEAGKTYSFDLVEHR